MVDRIKQLIELKGLTPAVFAQEININRSGLSHIFSGRNLPSLDLIKKILETYPEISTEWLMFGHGDVFRNQESASIKPELPIQTKPSPPDLFTYSETTATTKYEETVEKEKEITNYTDTPPKLEISTVIQTPIKVKSKQKSKNENKEDIQTPTKKEVQIINSQTVKKIEKIVFFYSDNTFTVYEPK